jgi:hypothetical protein
MRIALIILFLLGLGLSGWYATSLHREVMTRKAHKEDLAEINRVNYELFNVELWKKEALAIFEKKIKDFEISNTMYGFLDQQVQGYLNTMYDRYIESGELVDLIVDEVEKGGKVPKLFLNVIKTNVVDQVDQMDLRKQIPGLSKQVVDEIRANEELIKTYMQRELLRLVLEDSARDISDRRQLIYDKYNKENLDGTEQYLTDQIATADQLISQKFMYLLVGIGGLLLLCVMLYNISVEWATGGLTLVSTLLLVLGVTLPMIDIDARLDSFIFELLGEPISFDEQVIYFQSKSIVEVTKTLWDSGGADLKIVGALVLLFSVVFPFIKLTLSAGYLFMTSLKSSKVVQNIIFHLGKWSMADVFVVAIFMAYIGMYGIITAQLGAIDNSRQGFVVETLNYSRLSLGAYFFTGYTILSIVVGIIINRRTLIDRDV